MNRDELRSRALGLPPRESLVNQRAVLHPSEPGGGTWICLNDSGTSFALINAYAVSKRAPEPSLSRGGVVSLLRDCDDLHDGVARLATLDLRRINPFRLIAFLPRSQRVVEWRWDLIALSCCHHPWVPQQWLSSGFDEPTAQRIRGQVFRSRCRDFDAGASQWLRRLHASHDPEPGPFSTCMHRHDAATVSYTEVEVHDGLGIMRYRPGTPCEGQPLSEARMVLTTSSPWVTERGSSDENGVSLGSMSCCHIPIPRWQ